MAVDLTAVATASVEVDWTDSLMFDHVLSDVSARYRDCRYRWGSARRSNPQRPVTASGEGSMTLLGVDFVPGASTALTLEQLNGRHRIRIVEHVGAAPIMGWMVLATNPSRSRTSGRSTQFRLEGLETDGLRTEIELVQPTDGAAHDSPEVQALLTAAAGRAVDLDVRPTNLAPFMFAGRRGELLSQLGLALSGRPLSGRAGAFRVVDPTLVPAGARPLVSSDLAVLDASSEIDTAQIRNSAIVGVELEAGATQETTQTVELELSSMTARAAGSTITLTGTADLLALEAGDQYVDVAVELLSLTVTVANDITYDGRSTAALSFWSGEQEVNVDAGGASPMFTRSGGTVSIELELAADWPPLTNTTVRVRFAPAFTGGVDVVTTVGTFGNPDWFWQTRTSPAAISSFVSDTAAAEFAALVTKITARIQLTYGRQTGAAIDQLVVTNPASINTWGERPVEFPAWIRRTDTLRIQAILNALGSTRRVHVIDLALPQPTDTLTAQVAALEPGDFIDARINDPRFEVNINSIAMIFACETMLKQRGQSLRRIWIIDTGPQAGGGSYSHGYSDGYEGGGP